MANAMTYAEIVAAVESAAKQFTGGKETMVKYLVNMVYLTELIDPDDLWPPFWLCQLNTSRKTVPPMAITGITAANPGVVTTSTAHGMISSDIIGLTDILGMIELNERLAQILVIDSTSFSIGIDTSAFTAYSSGGRVLHRGITLDHSAERIIHAGWEGYSGLMTPYTPAEWEKDSTHHNQYSTGLPKSYYFGKNISASGAITNQVIWSPGTDAVYRLRYWYMEDVARLSADGDVPRIPYRFHDAIVSGVMARVAANDKMVQVGIENQTLWPTIYTAQRQALIDFNRKYWENIDAQATTVHFMA